MKFIVVIATLVALSCAAPTSNLPHPSPIDPSVLVELKPEEKVVLITDPKEIAKFKRESILPLYPTALPDEQLHHISKRDHKPGHETKPENKPKAPEPPKKAASHPSTTTRKPPQKPHVDLSKKPSLNTRNRRDVETYQKPQTLPAYNHHHGIDSHQGLQKPTLPALLEEKTNTTPPQLFQKPQTLPAILTETSETSQQHKRDIPVPLVPKHQHPEESPKESSEENSDEEHKKEKSSERIQHENHPNKDEVQVEDLSETKPFHQTLKFNHDIPAVATSEDEQKPNIFNDHLSDTEQHPLIRPKPVPVAELFARAHDS